MELKGYKRQNKMLVAVDCIIFGFDGEEIKLLVIKRGFEPEKDAWSLMGGFVEPTESFETAAQRVLKQLTGLNDVYLEQLHAFGSPGRDPKERTASIAYFALIDVSSYEEQISSDFYAQWFPLSKHPALIFDHMEMIAMAKEKLQYKAAVQPVLFELLPPKFTLPQLQNLYESVYESEFDKRNFSRKVLSTGLLVKQKQKDKTGSRKGAFYYKLDKKRYKRLFNSFLNFVPQTRKE